MIGLKYNRINKARNGMEYARTPTILSDINLNYSFKYLPHIPVAL